MLEAAIIRLLRQAPTIDIMFPMNHGTSEVVPDSWTVGLKDNVTSTASEHAAWASSVHQQDPGGFAGVQEIYEWTLIDMKGYMDKLTKQTAELIRNNNKIRALLQILPSLCLTEKQCT